jgi:hypothetical protein
MLRSLAVVIVGAIVGVLPARLGAERALGTAGIFLSIDQRGSLTDRQVDIAVDQVRQIWGAAGIEVSASPFNRPSLMDARVSLRVLTAAPARRPAGHIVLGWVMRGGDGTLTPVMFISLPGISELLREYRFSGAGHHDLPISLRDRITAQTVGRVSAHELGHYLLQTPAHGPSGLMRREFVARDLANPSLTSFLLSAGESARLRRELTALAMAQATVRD